jgi:hypothetical protein
LTTYDHTGVAAIALVLSQNSPLEVKLLVCGGLALSHLPLDAIPHRHWYGFERLKFSRKDQLGALVELVGGLVVLPILLSVYCHLNFIWLMLYALSASALDCLVGLNIGWAKKINLVVHFWEKGFDVVDTTFFEIFVTVLIFCYLVLALGGSL